MSYLVEILLPLSGDDGPTVLERIHRPRPEGQRLPIFASTFLREFPALFTAFFTVSLETPSFVACSGLRDPDRRRPSRDPALCLGTW